MTCKTLFIALLCIFSLHLQAAPPGDSLATVSDDFKLFTDSVNKALEYQTGKVDIADAKVTLNIPAGFKFLNAQQSKYVLTDIWGNPETNAEGVWGMIFPENASPMDDSSYAFVVSYDEIGYVKDHDANDIDYEELLEDIREDEKTSNAERTKAGYEEVHIVGWAQKPFYDNKRKILHWAKELRFGNGDGPNTLNYEIRILGRKGMLSLNAVGRIDQLSAVNNDITKILDIAAFTNGHTYSDFDPDVDEVAAWTIGGLVAGKLLLKAGILATILKFLAPLWKFILMALLPIGAFFKKFFQRKKERELPVAVENSTEDVERDENIT